MIDSTFPETHDVLIERDVVVVRLFSGDIFTYCVKYSGLCGDVKYINENWCPGKSWEIVVSAKRLHGGKNFLEGKRNSCLTETEFNNAFAASSRILQLLQRVQEVP